MLTSYHKRLDFGVVLTLIIRGLLRCNTEGGLHGTYFAKDQFSVSMKLSLSSNGAENAKYAAAGVNVGFFALGVKGFVL